MNMNMRQLIKWTIRAGAVVMMASGIAAAQDKVGTTGAQFLED